MDLARLTKDFPDLPIVKPSDLFKSGKVSRRITPEMLSGIDAIVLRTKLHGQLTYDYTLHDVIVAYDRDYAVRKLSKELALVLKNIDQDAWLSFASECWGNANNDR